MCLRRRFLIFCLLASLSLGLSGCGEEWRILKILINPAPLLGDETVQSVSLVADSSQSILIEAVFERAPSYSGLSQIPPAKPEA